MKRTLFFIITILLSINAYCQIQDTFFECKLGEVSMNQVKSNLTKLGYEYQIMVDQGETRIAVLDSRYNGAHWDAILIQFYKDLFYEIIFMKMSDDENEIQDDYAFYEKIFNVKYPDFYMDKEYVTARGDAKKTEKYYDYKNEISLKLEHLELNYKTLVLTYTHRTLAEKMMFEQIGSY